jgi:phage shock protein A
MNALKRLLLSIKHQLGEIVDELENHEAVATAAIEDLVALGARMRVQAGQADRRLGLIAAEMERQQTEASLWSTRAVEIRETDEARALECVRRYRRAEQAVERLRQQQAETRHLRERIDADLDRHAAKLADLKHKKEVLLSRQTQMESEEVLNTFGQKKVRADLEVFDRWEDRLAAAGLPDEEASLLTEEDPFASEFDRAEEEAALRATLDRLSLGQGQKPKPASP